jgi:hypothetical protein
MTGEGLGKPNVSPRGARQLQIGSRDTHRQHRADSVRIIDRGMTGSAVGDQRHSRRPPFDAQVSEPRFRQ